MRSDRATSAPARLTRWEILGAWLHVWTPPKGPEVPPVPWRKVGIWGAAAAVVIAVAAALIVPAVNDAKRRGAAERARKEAAANAAERARLRVDQRVHETVMAAGTALVPALESAITADAHARARAGKLDGPVLSTTCQPAGADVIMFKGSRVYKCFVTTNAGQRQVNGDVLGTGYPFVATVYPRTRLLAWCKENPYADEKGHRGAAHVGLSPACAGKLSQIL